MLIGLLFNFLTGLLWAAVGVCVTTARRTKCHVEHFYIIGSLISVLIIVLWQLCHGELIPPVWSWFVFACMIVGSTLNALCNTCTMLCMNGTGAALYFALARIGFSISFLFSVFVWHEQANFLKFAGIACLVIAVACSAIAKRGGAASGTAPAFSHKRLILSLTASLCSGFSQICMVFPYSKPFADQNIPTLPALTKATLVFLTNITLFTGVTLSRKYHEKIHYRPLLTVCLIWGFLAVFSYACLFATLSYLGPEGHSGLVFPIGGAVQIFAFAVFARCYWKEKLNPLQIAALIFIILGIFAVNL